MTQHTEDNRSDTGLAIDAARAAAAWVAAEGPLTESQGRELVGLQRPDSAQEEDAIWREVRGWADLLSTAVTKAEQNPVRVLAAAQNAVPPMRKSLEGILRFALSEGPQSHADVRARLAAFIERHGGPLSDTLHNAAKKPMPESQNPAGGRASI